jgi:hypothetical protein
MSTMPLHNWPPNYTKILQNRQENYLRIKDNPEAQQALKIFYKDNPVNFINDWCIVYEPRNAMKPNATTLMPFRLFPKQVDLVEFVYSCIHDQEEGLIEKSRDMGATWVCVAISTHLWLFHEGSSVGWGSRKQDYVDEIGNPSSIFEKIRIGIDYIPDWLKPKGFDRKRDLTFCKCINRETGSTIVGEIGDDIGRGGRTTNYFLDESAHYVRPEKIEAAISENTDVPIHISSVKGVGNVFYKKRHTGVIWDPKNKPPKKYTRVFIMDWSDHPAKDQEWYDLKQAKAKRQGLENLFAQEVDRDYTSSVSGILIPGKWVKAAIDAHIKLGFEAEGKKRAGFDVFDEGKDAHALFIIKGSVAQFAKKWTNGDTGQGTRKAIRLCKENKTFHFQFDSIGVGAGAKSETNRMKEEGKLEGFEVIKWAGSAKVQNPEENIIPGDIETPKNKDYYKNLKAQGGWQLRLRFEKTYKAVTQGAKYDTSELISIPSDLPERTRVEAELSQPTYIEDGSGKIIINKTPDGTKSPNLFDAFVMSAFILKKPEPQMGAAMPGGFKNTESY